ncbi:MAG: redoxin domain-containing protein [Isosphaerales bacterium]
MFRPPVSHRLMMISLVSGLVLAFATSGVSRADEPAPRSELPLDRSLMQRLANFTLDDVTSGRTLTLYGFQGRKAIVLVFLGNDCPVANLYVPRLIELEREYRKQGVVMLGINSNAHETVKDVARFVREAGIAFPVLKDPSNIVADSALVERTCEVVVLDGFARIRYRGAIDDQYQQGKSKDAPDHTYLRDALTALLSNKDIKVRATKVAGCLLDRVEPKLVEQSNAPRIRPAAPELVNELKAREKNHPVEVGKVSFASDVAAIIQNKCQTCHRPGRVGPFSLLTYDDARKHSAMIREVVEERRMPPWHADPRYGHFANDRSLSAKERATLMAWVDQGNPLGDTKEMPPPRTFAKGWEIGQPDVVFEMPETYYVPAQGVVSYVYFRVPTNFKEDRWVQAAEALPGDPSVVHHIIVYVMDRSKGPSGPGARRRPMHFTGYAPGDAPSVFPEGTAKRIPAGADLLLQVHYTPNGRVRTDRSKVGFVFAKTKPTREAFTIGIANPDLLLPARADNIAVASSLVLSGEARLLSLFPHMHLRGKDFKFTVTKPGESPQVALSVPAYDFGWQTYYILSEPMNLPKGTRVDCLAHFDNSESNAYNPDPNKLVRWGEQTFEEMMIGYLDMDVPVGTPVLNGSDFLPAFERGSMMAVQALRRLVGGKDADYQPRRPPR